MKMKDEPIIYKITEKGKMAFREVENAYKEWLEESGLNEEELMKYKNVKCFHIIDQEEGIALGYYDENKEEKMIGSGICRECFDTATWIFTYICARFDMENNYRSDFSNTFIKWSKKYDKRRK